MKLIIFDIETTGLSHVYDDIIQIAAVRVRSSTWEVEESFETFVRPLRRVPHHITALTGITHGQVAQAPVATDALVRFSRFVGEDSTMIAHNGARFDMPFLHKSSLRHGLGVRPTKSLDSISLSRKVWGGKGHGLDAVLHRLELSASGMQRHDARVDVDLLHQAVRIMWGRLGAEPKTCPVTIGSGMIPAC